MQGTSSLTAYAGQTITLQASGSLLARNYGALLAGSSSLSARAALSGAATLSASSTLLAYGTYMQGGFAWLPQLNSIGGSSNPGFGTAFAELQPLSSSGSGGLYIPPDPVMGYGNLPSLVSSGIIIKSSPGTGDVSLPALTSKGGGAGYGEGIGYLQPLTSSGQFGLKNVAQVFSGMVLKSEHITGFMDAIIVFNSAGQLSDTIAGSKEYIQSIISAINGSSQFSVIGEFSAEVMSFIASSAFNIGQTVVNGVTAPSLNDSSRVWVVNMETMASSQYEDYGFTHLFNHAGAGHGIADDGIYKLTGDTDAGADISALLEIGRSNYGSDKIKKIHKVWIGVGSDDTMYLKADADGTTVLYKTREFSTDVKNHEVLTGKRLYGNFWNWTIMNKDGADFVLATVDFQPIELNRRQR